MAKTASALPQISFEALALRTVALTGAGHKLLCALATFARRRIGEECGLCWPALPTLCEAAGVSRRTAQRQVQILAARGLIRHERGGGRRSSHYVLIPEALGRAPSAISAAQPEAPSAISAAQPEAPSAISAAQPEAPSAISAAQPEAPLSHGNDDTSGVSKWHPNLRTEQPPLGGVGQFDHRRKRERADRPEAVDAALDLWRDYASAKGWPAAPAYPVVRRKVAKLLRSLGLDGWRNALETASKTPYLLAIQPGIWFFFKRIKRILAGAYAPRLPKAPEPQQQAQSPQIAPQAVPIPKPPQAPPQPEFKRAPPWAAHLWEVICRGRYDALAPHDSRLAQWAGETPEPLNDDWRKAHALWKLQKAKEAEAEQTPAEREAALAQEDELERAALAEQREFARRAAIIRASQTPVWQRKDTEAPQSASEGYGNAPRPLGGWR